MTYELSRISGSEQIEIGYSQSTDRCLSKIGFIGMSPNNSVYGEEFTLPDGRTGRPIQESETRFTVSVDGLAARYSTDELREIGAGDVDAGKMAVFNALTGDPESFQFGCTKPAIAVAADELIIAGEVEQIAINQ